MWLLSKILPDSSLGRYRGDLKQYYIKPGSEFTIGRSSIQSGAGSQMLINLNLSQSYILPLHAVITVSDNPQHEDAHYIFITDKSGGSTYVNSKQVNSMIDLKEDDIITFTEQQESYRLEWKPVTLISSSLLQGQVDALVQNKGYIHSVNKFTSGVSHYISDKFTITEKILSAISRCVAIVTIDWLKALINAIDQSESIPLAKHYLPVCIDQSFNNLDFSLFNPNPQRRTLFSGIIFHFLTRGQIELFRTPIAQCGGSSVLVALHIHDVMHIYIEELLLPGHIVISATSKHLKEFNEQQNQFINHLEAGLKRVQRKMLKDKTIIYSIIYMSADYCNPTASNKAITARSSAQLAPSKTTPTPDIKKEPGDVNIKVESDGAAYSYPPLTPLPDISHNTKVLVDSPSHLEQLVSSTNGRFKLPSQTARAESPILSSNIMNMSGNNSIRKCMNQIVTSTPNVSDKDEIPLKQKIGIVNTPNLACNNHNNNNNNNKDITEISNKYQEGNSVWIRSASKSNNSITTVDISIDGDIVSRDPSITVSHKPTIYLSQPAVKFKKQLHIPFKESMTRNAKPIHRAYTSFNCETSVLSPDPCKRLKIEKHY